MDEEDLELQLVIDRSGSMAGDPLANAKRAAQTLVDVVPQGRTALGVETFNDSVRQDVAITPIPGEAARTTIKNTIGTIAAGGQTALLDAAGAALAGLRAYRDAHHTNANRVVFLLTDGLDNSSSLSQADVTAAYLAADVPLITFGYGSSRRTACYASSPTTPAASSRLADDVLPDPDRFPGRHLLGLLDAALSSFQARLPPPGARASLILRSTEPSESLTLLVNYDGPVNGLQLSVAAPNGPVSGVAFSCQATGSVNSCVGQVTAASVAAGGNGTWS